MKKYIFVIFIFFLVFSNNVHAQWERASQNSVSRTISIDTKGNEIVSTFNGSRIYYSNNNGDSWTDITCNLIGLSGNNGQCFERVKFYADKIIFLRNGGLFSFDFFKKEWTQLFEKSIIAYELKSNSIFYATLSNYYPSEGKLIFKEYNLLEQSIKFLDTLIIPAKSLIIDLEIRQLQEDIYVSIMVESLIDFIRPDTDDLYKLDANKKFQSISKLGLPNKFKFIDFAYTDNFIYAFVINRSYLGLETINKNELYFFNSIFWELISPPTNVQKEIKNFSAGNNAFFLFYDSSYFFSNLDGLIWTEQFYNEVNSQLAFNKYSEYVVFSNTVQRPRNTLKVNAENKFIIPTDYGLVQTNSLDGSEIKYKNKNIKTGNHYGIAALNDSLYTFFPSIGFFGNQVLKSNWDYLPNLFSTVNLTNDYYWNYAIQNNYSDHIIIESGYTNKFLIKSPNKPFRSLFYADSVLYSQKIIGNISSQYYLIEYNSRLYQSKDLGITWEQPALNMLKLPDSTGAKLVGNNNYWLWINRDSIFISKDEGENWKSNIGGLPPKFRIKYGPFQTKWGTFIVGKQKLKTGFDSLYLFRGDHWEARSVFKYSLSTDYSNFYEFKGNIIMAFRKSTDGDNNSIKYIFISKNLGKSFQLINEGLPPYMSIDKMCFIKDTLYLSSNLDGLWKMAFEEVVKDTSGQGDSTNNYVAIERGVLISIYPNPNYGILFIDGKFPNQEKLKIELYNTEGILVNELEVNTDLNLSNYALDTKKLNSGFYYLRITGNRGTNFQKKLSIIHLSRN